MRPRSCRRSSPTTPTASPRSARCIDHECPPRHGRPPGQAPEDRLRPAIHDLPWRARQSRGWPAFAGHDGMGIARASLMSGALLLVEALNGLQLGVLLFLIAAGLTLVFGVLDLVNLAHGTQYMLGAYLAVTFAAWTGSFAAGLVLAALGALLIGIVLERLIFNALLERSHLDQVLATYGLILLLEEGAKTVWGA